MQERLSPDNYMKLYHRTLNHSLEDGKNENIKRAVDAFSNLNPSLAAESVKEKLDDKASNTFVSLDYKQIVVTGIILISIGAVSGFLGNYLWQKYKEG